MAVEVEAAAVVLVAHPAALAADRAPAASVAVAALAVVTAARRAKLFKTLFAWRHANGLTQVAIRQARLPVGMSNTVEARELLYARPVQAVIARSAATRRSMCASCPRQ